MDEKLLGKDKDTYEAMLNILEDIEQSNKLLKKEKENAQTFLDIAGTMFIILDTAGKIKFINKKGCETLGMKKKQLLRKKIFSFFSEKENEKMKKLYPEFIKGNSKEFQHYRSKIKTKNGLCHIDWNNALLEDEDEISVIMSGTDITNEINAYNSLDSERRFKESVIKDAGVPIIVFDKKGQTIIINNAFQKLTGYGLEDVDSLKKLLKVACPEKTVSSKVQKAIKKTYKKGLSENIVFPILCKSGLTTILVGNFSILKNRKDNVTNLMMFLRDLSEIFNLENEVRQWAANGFTQLVEGHKNKIEISEGKNGKS